MPNAVEQHAALAEKSGFTAAATQARQLADRARRLAIAYEHYRFVSEEKINAFKKRLRETSTKHEGYTTSYDTLRIRPAADYPGLPPADVLAAVQAATDRACFDAFEVADIETVREVADPIVFGRITGCSDRFFIADWGVDVRITDLLGENDG